MSEEVSNVIRWINLVLALVGFLWLLFKSNHYWSEYTTYTKYYVISLLTFALSVIYGTAESLALHVTGGYRVLLATIAICSMIYALWKTRGRTGGRSVS